MKPLLCVLLLFILWLPRSSQAQKIADASPSVYAISEADFAKSLSEIDRLISIGSWQQARTRYQTLMAHDLPNDRRQTIRNLLDDLNIKMLFSPIETETSLMYTVKPGDSLYVIAKTYGTTVELLKRSNHLKSDTIYPGMTLKVTQAEFSILVDKSDNLLKLAANGKVFKVYPVATGTDNSTPIGEFTIETKLIDPVWYTTGAIVPPESPENILGTRWLGFSMRGYGIHGTTLPDSIGTQSTKGCVRMHNRDVEELYAIVPLKTKVTVVN
jgi:lipoprotein-anchoring transpeptidase ErfK/SrfK